MLPRLAPRVVIWSGLATALLLAVAAVYFAVFALDGGLQTVLDTLAPPEWAFTQFVVLAGLVFLYLLAAVVLTVSLAVVQLEVRPWWAVVGGLGALAAGAGFLVASPQPSIDVLAYPGFAVYMVATNVVGFRSRQLTAVTAGVGLASALLLLAAPLAGGGVGTAVSLALAILLYGAWAARLGISAWRRPALGRSDRAPLEAVLQSGLGAR